MLRSIVLFAIMGTAAAGCTTLWEPKEFPTDASGCHKYLEESGWTFGTNGNSELLVCNTPSYPIPADYFSFYVYGVNDESTNPNSHIKRDLPEGYDTVKVHYGNVCGETIVKTKPEYGEAKIVETTHFAECYSGTGDAPDVSEGFLFEHSYIEGDVLVIEEKGIANVAVKKVQVCN
mmetsp:Transcript_84677/g.169424  ORF Transcript_84677/g.169424 Transcript_84677/m.169424 type:complete len:176 (-) Transcript_84677:16-543(-)